MPLTMVGVGESRPIIRIGGSDKVRTHLEWFAWFPISPAT